METPRISLGVALGNRDFFPDALVVAVRTEIAALLDQVGVDAVRLGPEDTKLGGVETHADALRCGGLGFAGARPAGVE